MLNGKVKPFTAGSTIDITNVMKTICEWPEHLT